MLIICFIITALLPYLLCGINSAIIVTKIKSGDDIRTLGSGNAGLTNTLRTQGKLAALFVLLGDVAKGVLSVVFVGLSFRLLADIDPWSAGSEYEWALYASGASAILGHVFPVYYGFKGGKGVLVTVAAVGHRLATRGDTFGYIRSYCSRFKIRFTGKLHCRRLISLYGADIRYNREKRLFLG